MRRVQHFPFFKKKKILCTRFWIGDKVTVHAHKLLFMHYSQDSQPLYLKKILKIGPMALFTHLKIILLQCFQQNKLYLNKPLLLKAPTTFQVLSFASSSLFCFLFFCLSLIFFEFLLAMTTKYSQFEEYLLVNECDQGFKGVLTVAYYRG